MGPTLLLTLGIAMSSVACLGQVALEHARYWVREAEGSVQVAVVRNASSSGPFSVRCSTTNGTAIAGVDYHPVSVILDFAAEESIKLVAIPIVIDGDKDSSRTFTVGLGTPSVGTTLAFPRTATVTLLDDDPGIGFVQDKRWVQESEDTAVLTVTRGNDVRLEAFEVDYATVDGTARAGRDYAATTGTLAFAAGEMTRTVEIPILRTELPSKDRQFRVLLERATGGLPTGTTSGTVTILDTREMQPHRIGGLRFRPDGAVALDLVGGYSPDSGVSNRFRSNFDIVPIEASTDLREWTPRAWVVRTNASGAALAWNETDLPGGGPRFYRTPETTFVAPQRPPSGPFPVGFVDRVLSDDARRNRFRISTNGSFPLTVWYPARRVAGRWPDAPYHPAAMARDPRPGVWEGAVDRSQYWKRYAMENAPFAPDLTGLPVVIWSSGYLFSRFDVQEWAEHLASHGYVVVAADHADSSAVVFPDGRYLYTHYDDTVGRQVDLPLLQDRVRDCTTILDALSRWNQDDPLLAGRLDPRNCASMGWSLGGGTAIEFCRLDPRVKAAISLDGAFLNLDVLRSAGVPKPVLEMSRLGGSDTTLFDAVNQEALFFEIRGIPHDGFSTYYWDLVPPLPDAGRESARTIVDFSLWFLNRHLEAASDPMPPAADYRLIANLRRK